MKFAYRGTVVAILLLAALAVVGFAVLDSTWFHSYVRDRLLTLIDENTGGRAEFGDYQVQWRRLRVRVQPFILHGKEDPSRDPFVRVESAEIGLKILSLWKRDIDLMEFTATRPEIHIYVDKDGNTNLPSPKTPPTGKNPVEEFLRLAIDKVELREGIAEYDSVKVPFSISAQGLTASLAYDFAGPRYRGAIGAREILVNRQYRIGLQGGFLLEGNRLAIESGRIASGTSSADITASLADFKNPSIEVKYRASVNLKELPPSPVTGGRADLDGVLTYTAAAGYKTNGRARIANLAASQATWQIDGADVSSTYSLTADSLDLTDTVIHALGGSWSGAARLRQWRSFELEGTVDGMQVNDLVKVRREQALPWDGRLSGPVKAAGRITKDGVVDFLASAQTRIEPLPGQLPVSGEINLTFDQNNGSLNLGSSYVKTEDSRLSFRGVLGRHLEVGIRTIDTQEIEPIIRVISGNDTFRFPVALVSGEATFEGVVDGPLDNPLIRGHLLTRGLEFEGHILDRVEADTTLSRGSLGVTNATLAQGDARITGSLHLGLTDWNPGGNPPLTAALAMRNVDLMRILKENRIDVPVSGRLSASAGIEGTLGAPKAAVRFTLDGPEIYGDQFKRISGRLQYNGGASDRFEGSLALDQARFDLGGEYRHQAADWKNGSLDLHVKLDRFNLGASEKLQAQTPGLTGEVIAEFTSAVQVAGGRILVRALDGRAAASNVTFRNQPLGDLVITSATKAGALAVEAEGNLRNTRATATATVQLVDGYPLKGTLNAPRLTFRLLSDLAGQDFGAEGPPIRGFVQVAAQFSVPLADLSQGTATVVIDEARIRPRSSQIGDTQIDSSELSVRNQGPIHFSVNAKGIHITKAEFIAKDTDVALEGGFTFGSKSPWDTRLKGTINLGVLTTFNPDLVASGSSVINASLRGAGSNPELSGRMEIGNGSFYLKDIPNGIEKAEGVILFDRNRATIEKLTGQTGGGTFELKGFVSLAGQEILYRLQALVNQVRIRYPEGVSTTLDADLSLTGSTSSSLLTGTVTVQRSGFNPRGDIGGIFREPNRPPPPTISENRFLRSMQFDVRVRSSANAFFQSAFTQETQIEADIRLRGSPVKPIVLGSLKANSGEVEFFGNRYTITRGEVLFYNTAVIQPTLDFDVETRVRGVTVYINVNGPLDRVNVSYRSEPPLATSEIVALLTVGRTPGSISGVPQSSTLQRGNIIEQSPNTLLGGALSSAVSSRFERFFGVSRVKIDPGVTSLEGTYQSRITIEQSISKDVTVTFSTNLSKTQQQIIAVEWNLNKAWSAVVTRDDNGAFSVEFRLRKQF